MDLPRSEHRKALFFSSSFLNLHDLKVVTNEKGEAVGEVLTIIC
jgi:hypothetical protein